MSNAITALVDDGGVTVSVGRPLWTYVSGARRRPFIHPLRTPAGHVLTVDAPDDHPWHHGLWFTIKFVNGENFWEEYDEYGVLRHRGVPALVPAPEGPSNVGHLSVDGELEWIRPDRQTVVVTERRRWTHRPIDDLAYALDFETSLTPAVDVVLDRTPFTTWGGYGGLAFRGRPDLRDSRILLADGTLTERVEGVPSEWLDLSGTIDGHEVGVALIDAPGNPSHPVPWYGSTRHETYGADDGWSNFFNAAFLFYGPLTQSAGDPLHFRYRVIVHDGPGDPDRLRELAERFRREPAG